MKIVSKAAAITSVLLISIAAQERVKPPEQMDRAELLPLAEIDNKPISFYCIDFMATIIFKNLYEQDALCKRAQATFALNRIPIAAKGLGEPAGSPGTLHLIINAVPWSH